MEPKQSFFKQVCALAVPITMQSMLQASFSIVDQIMIGQLGSTQVAGVGLAGKFSSLFTVLVSAIATVTGIMISQYLGQKRLQSVARSFYVNLFVAIVAAVLFTALCLFLPNQIMGIYTRDPATRQAAASYLSILSVTYLPLAGASLLSALLRCLGKAALPLYAGIAAALLNTSLNYILIFGALGFPAMGADGAALATAISQITNFLMILILYRHHSRKAGRAVPVQCRAVPFDRKQYAAMLLPLLFCEILWSLGENVYAVIYGHLGTDACAAMTLTNPIQGLMIGALCGFSQAAGIIIGKLLGNSQYEETYQAANKLLLYGFSVTLPLSLLLLLVRGPYTEIYQVNPAVKIQTCQILTVYALIAPFKVQNMILGGILRSGGRTRLVLWIDLIGTWGFGVPLGLLAAFALKYSIPCVYFILSLEECVRFGISLVVLRKRIWMRRLES